MKKYRIIREFPSSLTKPEETVKTVVEADLDGYDTADRRRLNLAARDPSADFFLEEDDGWHE
jgi:hypothetical protein